MKTIQSLLLTAALSVSLTNGAWANDSDTLNLKVYNADGNSFHVNSVLVTGEHDAVLIDAQFSRADAHRLVAEILKSQKRLTTVYVSHGDPDYYFGLEVIKAEFPDVKIVASKPTIAWIKQTVQKKVGFWGPKMGANAPRKPIIPSELPAEGLILEGKKLEIKGLDGELPGRSYVWIPSIKAVVGGVNVFSGLHLWTADSQTPAERAAWFSILEGIESLGPDTVIPGHANSGAPTGLAAVEFSKTYLRRFESSLEEAADAASLIQRMNQLYPTLGLGAALEIGAKVNKGEMKW
nr:MBL fold metallo-hydrolase [uncultured Amphritea sp.]